MRLLQICTSFNPGGIQRHITELSNTLSTKNHSIYLAGAKGPWIEHNTQFPYLPINLLGVSTHYHSANIFKRLINVIKCAKNLRKFIKDNDIQLIHAHESAPAIVAKIASFGLNIPLLVTFHGSAPDRVKPFGKVSKRIASLTLTPSYRCAEELSRQAGIKPDKIKVIGLGVEPPPSFEKDEIQEHRENLLGENKKFIVAIIARLDYQKGIDILVEVVQKIIEKRQDIQFIVVGDGNLRDKVKDWAEKAGIQEYLTFEGHSDKPYLYLLSADLFLLTSRWEALPITIAEAFQAGLPVVASNTGGVKELVSPDVGFVEEVGDIPALSKSILQIFDNDELRQHMSQQALKLSNEERFSIPYMHDIYERTYLEVLGRSNNSK